MSSERWERITCGEYEERLSIMGDHGFVYSSLTDLGGEFGEPIIETQWARDDDPDNPILKGVRHPALNGEGPDRSPCEHYFNMPKGGSR